MRAYIPMKAYDDASDSMDSLERINDIIDASPLDATAYGSFFAIFSMFIRIEKLLYASLGLALAVAFVIMLLSVHVGVALLIALIVVIVDADLLGRYQQHKHGTREQCARIIVCSVLLSLILSGTAGCCA